MSVQIRDVSKAFALRDGRKRVILRNQSAKFEQGERVAILGRNGAGKSTFLKMLAGTQDVDRGLITRRGAVSWPIGFAGSFHPELTGAQNTRFAARVYGVDTDFMLDYAQDFSEVGAYIHMPLRTYSSGMRARLAFAISMAIPFATYLIDEVTSVGDGAFRRKCHDTLMHRLEGRTAIIVSHSMAMVRDICDRAVVLEAGRLSVFDNVDAAIECHERNMCA